MLKKFIQSALLFVVLCTTVHSYAQVSQAPDGIQFQALATDANGHPAAGRVIYVKNAIIAKTATGTIVYAETFKVTASSAGVFSIVLGKGTYASGVSSIANIDWANGPFFLNLKVAVEPTIPTASWNVNNEYVDMGTSQFWSVPYALYAGNVKGADTKLNIADTIAMLKPYFTSINLKANIESPTFTGTVKGITKAMVGLGNVDNTSDLDKLISTATQVALDLKANATDVTAGLNLKANATDVNTALALKANVTDIAAGLNLKANATDVTAGLATKVDKVTGKDLSSNDYTTLEKTKLAAITGTNTGDQINITGNAATATKLIAPKNINGIPFDGSADITVPAAASTLSGIVQVANGGTGSSTQNFVDLTTAQTIAGAKTFNSDIKVNGLLVGVGAGGINTNTALGNIALANNSTGYSNVAVGAAALTSNTTGFYNTALGKDALKTNIAGLENTGIGLSSLYSNVGGSYNTALGSSSLVGNISGEYNVAVGRQALGNTTTGSNNVAVGAAALNTNTTGSSNTAIGRSADVATNNISNATAIGYGAIVLANNTIQLGNSGVTNVNTSGTITAGAVTYPNAHGTANQVLTTTGTGILTWTAPSTIATSYSGILPIANGGTGQTTVPGILSTLGFASNNVAIGSVAGTPNQGVNAGTIAIGGGAGRGNQGQASIAIGYVSGDQNQGAVSISIGPNAAQANQAAESVAIGYAAGQNNQGTGAIAIGTFAGQSNQAAHSIALNAAGTTSPLNPSNAGFYVDPIRSATATTNLLFYNPTSKEITTATSNGSFVDLTTAQTIAGTKTFNSDITVNGVKIGRGNGNNGENVAVGADALASGTGTRNTAIGYGAMRKYSGTSFDNNTSIGYYNLPNMTSGSGNTSVGAESMMANITGTQNTSVGNQSLINSTGNNNVGIGKRSGQTITSGSQNTIIGTDADVSTATLTNASALGYGAIVTADNTVQLGSTTVTNVNTSGTITAGGLSVSGNVAVNTNKFNVTAANGNTSVAGTLDVTGATTLSSATVNGKVIAGASSAASSSAVLEANSTTQGFLPPRMTFDQRNAISSPVAGLVVWCSNCGTNGQIQVYNGTSWTNMIGGTAAVAPYTIGQAALGGVIAYILQSGDPGYDASVQHGLVASTANQSLSIPWSNNQTITTTGATGTAIGTGLANTNTIITIQGVTATSYAAGLARAHDGGGYTDWYLPSFDELKKLYINRVAIGNFQANWYWSSTESNLEDVHNNNVKYAARIVAFFYDGESSMHKNNSIPVRAIRAF